MVTGLYAALAASASVFIGILTALLASNLSNRDSERSQIIHRIKEIDSRLEGLDRQREELEDQIDDLRRALEKDDLEDDASQRVRQFINEHVMQDFSPDAEDFDLECVIEEFADYEGIKTKEVYGNEFLTDELDARLHEIRHEAGVLSEFDEPFIRPTAEEVTAQQQMDVQQRIHHQNQHNQFQNRWHQTKTDIQALLNERSRLTPRYESLAAADTNLFRPILWTIALSVGVPLFAYLLRASGIAFLQYIPTWIETGIIFMIWIMGFIYVFWNLRIQVNTEATDLPEKPDVSIDEG